MCQWDHQQKSYLYALDKKTGKEAWTAERDEVTSWATPLVVEVNGKAQVITSASNKVRSYDAETGQVIWECTGMTKNVIPNPMYADGILYLMSGFRGTALKAVDLAKAQRRHYRHCCYSLGIQSGYTLHTKRIADGWKIVFSERK